MFQRVRRRLSSVLICLPLACNGIPGLLSPQDGTWQATPNPPGQIGSTAYILQISQDRVVRINAGGVEWTVQQANPATRNGTQIIWKTTAAPPAGSIIPLTSVEYTFDVMSQLDGTLSGTVTQAIPVIPGIISIPTTSYQMIMRRI